MASVGILFPGQGSQTVGMGADLFESRPDLLGDSADEILGFSLRRLCLDGPEEELTRTEHAQPALFALSYALWEMVESENGLRPDGAAGHSLGEYTALTSAGVFEFEAGLGLVASRGRAMAHAAADAESGMAALLGADRQSAEEVCQARRHEGGSLWVANVNAPGQIVVAGGRDDLAWLAEHAPEMGFRRVIPLKVAGAFHSPFMATARAELATALEATQISEPGFPVWSNTTARPHGSDELEELLARQLVEPVLFSDSLQDMAAAGVDTFIHVGPGDVTAGLARKAVEGAEVHTISAVADIRPVLDVVGTMDRH